MARALNQLLQLLPGTLGMPGRDLIGPPSWRRSELAGRLVEISSEGSSVTLSLASRLVLEAQEDDEPVAWLLAGTDPFFAPDLEAAGVDLAALAVVRAGSVQAAGQAACRLLASGAFGLILLDLGVDPNVPMSLQARWVKLAQKHETAVVCLTGKRGGEVSLSSMVGLRCQSRRLRTDEGRFSCVVEALKDKRRGPGWQWTEARGGPPGLR